MSINPLRRRKARQSGRSRRTRLRARIVRWSGAAALVWVTATVSVVLALRWVDPPTTAFMIAAQLRGEETVSRWVDWADIPAELALAVVAAEDQRFPSHSGFDFVEIQDALETKLRGGRLRGASTISQQTAKNLFLWSGRSFLRKGLEAWFTVLLEALWPKRRILEVYLNVAQFGNGFYGIAAASRVYFGGPPEGLSRHQMALLASSLPDPVDLNPGAPGAHLLERAEFVRRHMQSLGGTGYIRNL